MRPTVLVKQPGGDLSLLGVAVTVSSLVVIWAQVCWALGNNQHRAEVLSLLPIPVLAIVAVVCYFPRKLAGINARYDAQRTSLARDGEWRVLCRSDAAVGDAPTVRFVGYDGFPPSGEHPQHDKQQWAPTLYEPSISALGIPRVTKWTKVTAGGAVMAWCTCWAAQWLSPPGGSHTLFLRAVMFVVPLVIAVSIVVCLAGLLVTTEVWFAPRLIRVRQSWAWRRKTVVKDFPVQPGFCATLSHGRPREPMWFIRFPHVLRLANPSGSVELPASGLRSDDFWWAVTSDYQTTPEDMDAFLAHGMR